MVRHHTTTRSEGDFAVGGDSARLAHLRAHAAPGRWTWLHQVHGADVVTVTRPGEHAGASADAAVTTVPGAVLAVHTADCAPIVLVGDAGIGVAHAGWRGLAAGVVGAAVGALEAAGTPARRAVLGPCIHAECYPFGADDLDAVAAVLGAGVRGVSRDGNPALDLPAAVRLALEDVGVTDVVDSGSCTSCAGDRYFSHRARGETGRMATIAWVEAAPGPVTG